MLIAERYNNSIPFPLPKNKVDRSSLFNKIPVVSKEENSASISLKVAATNLKKEDFKIDVEGTVLTLSFERKEIIDNESSYLSFQKSISLPKNIKEGMIETEYDNGIYSIILFKNLDLKPNRTNRFI